MNYNPETGLAFDIPHLIAIRYRIAFMPLTEQAKYRDAMVEEYINDPDFIEGQFGKMDWANINFKDWNATSVGNLAYVALSVKDRDDIAVNCMEALCRYREYIKRNNLVDTAPAINPRPILRGMVLACLLGTIIITLLLISFCGHTQTFTNPSNLNDNVFLPAVDTTLQVQGDTLFMTETWQGGFSVFVGGYGITDDIQPKYFRRRSLYLIKFLKDQEPRTIEVQETITRPVEVWIDKR